MRVKTGTVRRKKHRKTIKLAKGYRMTRSRLYKSAHEAVLHAGEYAFHGRKKKKRDLKKLWIVRLNAASRQEGLTYSQLVKKLKEAKIKINRKILAELAVHQPAILKKIIQKANNA